MHGFEWKCTELGNIMMDCEVAYSEIEGAGVKVYEWCEVSCVLKIREPIVVRFYNSNVIQPLNRGLYNYELFLKAHRVVYQPVMREDHELRIFSC